MKRERYRPFRGQYATCDRCGHSDIAWVKSARGKWYLAALSHDKSGQQWIDTYHFHSRDCDAFAAEREAWANRPTDGPFKEALSEAQSAVVEALVDRGEPVDDDGLALIDKAGALAQTDEHQEQIDRLRRRALASRPE